MNARAEMPDWTLMVWMLDAYAEKCTGQQRRDEAIEQAAALRAWLAAQSVAPEGGDAVERDAAIGRAFLKVLGEHDTAWRDTGAAGFISRVAKAAGQEPIEAATPPAPAREAVAWQYRIRLRDQWERWCNVSREEWEETHTSAHENIQYRRLFDEAPAAGAVVVDEKLVDAALEAYKAGDPWADIPTFCGMRAALTAAIGGGK